MNANLFYLKILLNVSKDDATHEILPKHAITSEDKSEEKTHQNVHAGSFEDQEKNMHKEIKLKQISTQETKENTTQTRNNTLERTSNADANKFNYAWISKGRMFRK